LLTVKRIIAQMSSEGFPSPFGNEFTDELDAQTRAELEAVFAVTSLEQFEEETGLGLAELAQQVTYETSDGTKMGTVAAMLSHADCPMGKWTRAAYQKGGIDEVKEMYQDLSRREPSLELKITPQTYAREADKKKVVEPEPIDSDESESLDNLTEIERRPAPENSSEIESEEGTINAIDISQIERQLDERLRPDKRATSVKSKNIDIKVRSEVEETVEIHKISSKAAPDRSEIKEIEAPEIVAIDRSQESAADLTEPAAPIVEVERLTEDKSPIAPAPKIIEVAREASSPSNEQLEIVSEPVDATFEDVASVLDETEEITVSTDEVSEQIANPETEAVDAAVNLRSTINEIVPMAEAQAEQTLRFLRILTKPIQERLSLVMDEGGPAAKVLGELIVNIARATDRLQDLKSIDQLDGEEAAQITEVLKVWYEELLTSLDVEADEASIDLLFQLILEQPTEIEPGVPEYLDEGTHEKKPGIFTLPHGLADAADLLRLRSIGKFTIGLMI
jgi:hypothetical protein